MESMAIEQSNCPKFLVLVSKSKDLTIQHIHVLYSYILLQDQVTKLNSLHFVKKSKLTLRTYYGLFIQQYLLESTEKLFTLTC